MTVGSDQYGAGWGYAIQPTEIAFRDQIAARGNNMSLELGQPLLAHDSDGLDPAGAVGARQKHESIEKQYGRNALIAAAYPQMWRSMSWLGMRNIVNDGVGNRRDRYIIGNESALSLIVDAQIEPDPISVLTRARDDLALFIGGTGSPNRAHELSDVARIDSPELTDTCRNFAAFAIEAIQ